VGTVTLASDLARALATMVRVSVQGGTVARGQHRSHDVVVRRGGSSLGRTLGRDDDFAIPDFATDPSWMPAPLATRPARSDLNPRTKWIWTLARLALPAWHDGVQRSAGVRVSFDRRAPTVSDVAGTKWPAVVVDYHAGEALGPAASIHLRANGVTQDVVVVENGRGGFFATGPEARERSKRDPRRSRSQNLGYGRGRQSRGCGETEHVGRICLVDQSGRGCCTTAPSRRWLRYLDRASRTWRVVGTPDT
jgi:hypothetical protein